MTNNFHLEKKSRKSNARVGVLRTAHGKVHTPFFMPIATKATVKGVETRDVKKLGAEIILSNTYHLFIQPGLQLIQKAGGLHGFMNTKLPILTDSGGFQIFSLSKLRSVDEQGVTFQSPIDGSTHRLTPKRSVEIQATLGSDIMMAFDLFPGFPASKKKAEESVRVTTDWAKQCVDAKRQLEKKKPSVKKQMLFGIVQGSTYEELRERSAKELTAMDFDGFAVGGLAVGEPPEKMYEVTGYTTPLLPENKPRYLMGVGYPEQIVESVKRGIDMFDCVIPTREGRHGRLFIWKKETLHHPFYEAIHIERSRFRNDLKPVDTTCDCPLCYNYSRAYLNHLFKTKDYLGQRLATMHNLRFYLNLMRRIRENINQGNI